MSAGGATSVDDVAGSGAGVGFAFGAAFVVFVFTVAFGLSVRGVVTGGAISGFGRLRIPIDTFIRWGSSDVTGAGLLGLSPGDAVDSPRWRVNAGVASSAAWCLAHEITVADSATSAPRIMRSWASDMPPCVATGVPGDPRESRRTRGPRRGALRAPVRAVRGRPRPAAEPSTHARGRGAIARTGMRIHLGTDHAGLAFSRTLREHLTAAGHEVVDHGPAAFDPLDDYPAFIIKAALAVARDATAGTPARGIVFGGSGNGEQIAANKVAGIRAALVWSEETARLARQHNDANVIAIGARLHTVDDALRYIDAFLAEPFSGDERHARRIAQIAAYEQTGTIVGNGDDPRGPRGQ